ncbi:MAG: 50S ribosomal protein L25 [Prevotella sp.]|nr:50S ribosomal protein L25 [Prevotella sp.]
MKEIAVKGQKRNETGKKATRELRKEGMIPCNLYGEKRGENGLPEAMAFAVSATEIRKAIYSPTVYVVNLDIDGEMHKAVIKELQFHPVSDQLLHADFYEINEEKPITIGIPVKLNGLAQGVRDGGRLSLIVRKVNVTAKYTDIPEVLDIDVTNLTIGKSIKVGELKFDNLEMATSKEVVVCTIKATRKSNAAAQDAEAAE